MRIFVAAAIVAAACGGTPGMGPAPEPARLPPVPLQPKTFTLPNGLTAILVEDPHADVARLLVRYRAGTVDEPAGQEGVAHLAAHVSYAPTDGKATLWDRQDRIETWIDVVPEAESTDFTAQVEPDDLPDALAIEAERLRRRCDGLTDRWFTWLRDEVSAELARIDTRATNRTINHALYPAGDPYARAYDATPASVSALTRAQTCAFMDAQYTPGNTIVVVSGPITAAEFQRMLATDLAAVPARPSPPRPPRPAPLAGGRTQLSADVAEPTVAVSWPLPADRGQRAVMVFAGTLVAEKLGTSMFTDDHQLLFWITKNAATPEAVLETLRNTLRAGLIEPADFERTRTRRITVMLGGLDSVASRVEAVARRDDLDAPFRALESVSPDGFEQQRAALFDWSRARVVELSPDGTRPKWRPASLADPRHDWRGPSEFTDVAAPSLAIADSRVLAQARTFKLANGMTVILAPTSPVPVIEMRLAFPAGASAEPPEHRGTANLAYSALEQIGKKPPQAADAEWAAGVRFAGAGWDSGGIDVAGPTMYADLLMSQFDGIPGGTLELADLDKGRAAMLEVAASPVHRAWDASAAERSSVYGNAHPYGQMKAPEQRDVQAFDARVVEAFYQRFIQPNNATLIVTGGFDPDALAKLVHQTFDRWQGKGDAVAAQAPRSRSGAFAQADQSSVVTFRVQWPAPGRGDALYEQRSTLASMLNQISSHAGATLVAARQGGAYMLAGRIDPATAAGEIRDIRDAIPLIAAGAPRYRAAFASALRRSARAFEAGGGSLEGWSRWIVTAVENGRDLGWLGGTGRRVANVTYTEVARLAAAELMPDRATWLVSGPRDAVTAVYAALGVQPTWLNP